MATFKNPHTIKTRCPYCGEIHEVTVEMADYADYNWGKHAQDAFPYLSASERELLISGICDKCWNRIFSE